MRVDGATFRERERAVGAKRKEHGASRSPYRVSMFATDGLTALHARLGVPPCEWSLTDRAGTLLTCHHATPLAIQAVGDINRMGARGRYPYTC